MSSEPANSVTCPECGAEYAPTFLACPRCARLTHANELATFAAIAREAESRHDYPEAMAAWRDALALLPRGSKQYETIARRITELGESGPAANPQTKTASTDQSLWWRAVTGIGAIGLLLWKSKALLAGLGKGSTLFSMFVSLGVYWTAWGWKFALGIILSIYVHEMGHVVALRRNGFRASAPMFIPGLGAIVRMQQQIVNPREDAEIGLAGPIYGLGAALFALALWFATRQPIFAAIAGVGAWINLFNLLPIASLDGGRGFHALNRQQRVIVTLVISPPGSRLPTACSCFSRSSVVGARSSKRPKRLAVGRRPSSSPRWSSRSRPFQP